MFLKIEKIRQIRTHDQGTGSSFIILSFWNCNGYPWNARIGIELINQMDIILLAQTWEHDNQRIQVLKTYNIHSLVQMKRPTH